MAQPIEVPEFLKQGFKFASQYFEGVAEVQSIDEAKQEVTLQRYPKTGPTPDSTVTEVMPLRQVVAGIMSGDYYEHITEGFEISEQEALYSAGLDQQNS